VPLVDPILLSVAPIATYNHGQHLTNATGFFFRRDGRLYLVTSRHVMIDEPAGHFPDALQIRLFTDPENLAQTVDFVIPLYRDGESLWRQVQDSAGVVDVAAIEIDCAALPETLVYREFSPESLCVPGEVVEVGSTLMVVGFPLGFSDTLHNLAVARQALLASAFGFRFQGMGYFLTDARTHRGLSGAPVVIRVDNGTPTAPDFHWRLLGGHSLRLDVSFRDLQADEALGLNCAWYVDSLLALTGPGGPPAQPIG